jgi:hypothetical protein
MGFWSWLLRWLAILLGNPQVMAALKRLLWELLLKVIKIARKRSPPKVAPIGAGS